MISNDILIKYTKTPKKCYKNIFFFFGYHKNIFWVGDILLYIQPFFIVRHKFQFSQYGNLISDIYKRWIRVNGQKQFSFPYDFVVNTELHKKKKKKNCQTAKRTSLVSYPETPTKFLF